MFVLQQIPSAVRQQTGPTGSRWGIKRRSVLSAVVVVGAALMAGAVLLLWPRLKGQPLSALRPGEGVVRTERLAELSNLEDPDSSLLRRTNGSGSSNASSDSRRAAPATAAEAASA